MAPVLNTVSRFIINETTDTYRPQNIPEQTQFFRVKQYYLTRTKHHSNLKDKRKKGSLLHLNVHSYRAVNKMNLGYDKTGKVHTNLLLRLVRVIPVADKSISITYYEFVYVALFVQQSKFMHRVIRGAFKF